MSESVVHDWPALTSAWSYAFAKPSVTGRIKVSPEDFLVEENLGFDPEPGGEHIWLRVSKRQQNTDAVAKALARHAKVAYRDVGYSGLKDLQACTRQWFSIYKPGKEELDWSDFDFPGVEIQTSQRCNRKLRRGSHKSNSFVIRVSELDGDVDELRHKIDTVQEFGVPNYFGEQRFGRGLNNMAQAYDLLVHNKRIKNRHVQGLIYSSARSWLFNCFVSKRIEDGSWNSLYPSEPTNLNGSNSLFKAENDIFEESRLAALDIHPTAPLWGRFDAEKVDEYADLHAFESSVIHDYCDLSKGLEKAKLEYQRRPIRLKVDDINYARDDNSIVLKFDLLKGQYATSVLRELLIIR